MGYSARYHAASLAAVFLALAIGILIGAEFGDDVVSSTRQNLEESLTSNLADARERADELAAELGRTNEFAERVYPALVGDRLDGQQVGILALGRLVRRSLRPDRGCAASRPERAWSRSAWSASRRTSAALAGELSGTRFPTS